jgi:4-hydroxy-tetrahydrodipicolinate synthase
VVAMMGRVEEIYRLPMVPVKRETRLKLQQIASEVGLLEPVPATVSDL